MEAPTPKALMRQNDVIDAPAYYGYEYHGLMNHKDSEQLLGKFFKFSTETYLKLNDFLQKIHLMDLT